MGLNSGFVDFVFGDGKEGITYFTHRTGAMANVNDIMKKGLFFNESFQKTTDLLLNDSIHIKYWQNLRKDYGAYTIVIGISSVILLNYQKLLNRLSSKNYEVQQVLTLDEPFETDDWDEIYTLPLQFIKGYWDSKKEKAIRNPKYDPSFDSPVFKSNIDQLLIREKERE